MLIFNKPYIEFMPFVKFAPAAFLSFTVHSFPFIRPGDSTRSRKKASTSYLQVFKVNFSINKQLNYMKNES